MKNTTAEKKYHIETLGCQANERDSQSIAGIFESLGIMKAKSISEADVVVINTCSVRQKSEDKAYGFGKELTKLKKSGKTPFVIMSGCLVGSTKGERVRFQFSELQTRVPWVSVFISPTEIRELPNILLKNEIVENIDLGINLKEHERAVRGESKSAFVNIATGCDNFCTFCVVPYARGEEISRSKEDILDEVNHLVSVGYEHITLVGQNVNSWGLSKDVKFKIRSGSDFNLPFEDLVRSVNDIEKVKKISFISSNPFDFTTGLINALTLPKMDNYLHIAIQSGNDEVLKRMNRRHTVEEFRKLITLIRKSKPELAIGTDIIVGFPGETREQFLDTAKLVEWAKFRVVYIAMYSARKGTVAEKFFKDDVEREEKKWRHAYLTKVFDENKSTFKW